MFNDLSVNLVAGKLDTSKPVRIQISMYNPFCTGKYLFALSEWVRRQGFNSIDYQVSDTLQRHNFIWRDDLKTEKAIAKSIESGEQWLSHNSAVIQLCYQTFDKVTISRWNFWIRHPEFQNERNFFQKLLEEDKGFREAVDSEVETYFIKTNRNLTKERLRLSREFLIEEIAVSEISSKYYPANEIYPGPRFSPEQYLVEAGIAGITMIEMSFIHVEFIDS